jgi:hypothetical protein
MTRGASGKAITKEGDKWVVKPSIVLPDNTYSRSINTSSLPARTAFMRVSWSRSL